MKEQIRRIWVIRDRFLNMASEPKASEHNNVVLSSRQLSLTFFIPETASRVTLATLGIVFQTKLPTTDNHQPNTYNQTPTTYHYIFLFIDILFLN